MVPTSEPHRIGFCCAYTPLPLLDAAGFEPVRLLPVSNAADQAGSLLHDNLCPHVKRILDRALARDLPPLGGVVFVNSCDAMRRLADAWPLARPGERLAFLDLPSANDERSVRRFGANLKALAETLSGWAGRPIDPASLVKSARMYSQLARGLAQLGQRAARGNFPGGWPAVQAVLNRSVTQPAREALLEVQRLLAQPETAAGGTGGVPVVLFGNVLPDPAALALFEECGLHLVDNDTCTGSRQLTVGELDEGRDPWEGLAAAILSRPPCARTLSPAQPGSLAARVVSEAREGGAKGVVAHVMKFCDPYLARLPAVREALREAGLPLLVLEGDCTLRSLGQHRTRIQGFAEMLAGDAS